MTQRKRKESEDVRWLGIFRERLWVILLPGLLALSVFGSTVATQHFRSALSDSSTEALERRMQMAVHELVPTVARAYELGDADQLSFLLDVIAQPFQGRCLLLDGAGVLVHESSPRKSGPSPVRERGSRVEHSGSDGEIIVWEPIRGMEGARLGELRLHVALPDNDAFSWSFWSVLIAAFSLVSAGVTLMVTRILAPLGRLGDFFRNLAEEGPSGVRLPEEGIAEFAQLKDDINYCLETMRNRQLLVEEHFVEIALDLAREFEIHREGKNGHARRTRRYAAWVGDSIRLQPEERDALDIAALVHDIGRHPINEDEPWDREGDIDHKHPIIGAGLFEAVPGLQSVAKIVRAHHENYDGSGFPDGLKDENIPVGARILRIVDHFERLITGWNGPTMSPEEALEEMRNDVGRYYDPTFFDCFREEVTRRIILREQRVVSFKAMKAVNESGQSSGKLYL
ncbi:MAG: HD-GYP domain-containing protein [Planctomycetota bacterium]